ncbi:Regulator of nonsense transcripts 2 like protein [Argiope bruennichi]|uniref:Regulator of nonsense transcripts 2 like protein n=1 Tax=Argiope bruennichi TaxID=94029 RepID=A0A8T0EQ52_ARGBR|nr:Regulator of nonsense transcripts 2 like protein [Argiope bruennichi]
MESRGKSWKREREERGRKQAIQQDGNGKKDAGEVYYEAEADRKNDKFDPKNNVVESGEKIQEQAVEEKDTVDTVSEEQRQELQQYIKELAEKLRLKAELRAININAENIRPEESFFSKLDSSLKKNTAFIKRLRNMTEMQRDSLIKDMEGLNLTKYISEAAAAIVDAKLKMSDVSTAVQVCSLLHRRYADFSAQLLEHWQKVLPMKKDEKISNPSKIRVDLRFYAELVSSGIFPLKEGLPLLGNLLTVLTVSDREEHSNVGIVLSFCRHCGEDYTGIVPRKYRLLSEKYQMELPKSDFLLPDRQKGLRCLLKEYFKSLCRHLVKDYKALENMEKQNLRILQTKGELSTDRKEKFEAAQTAFQKLLSNTEQFADIVDEDMPHLPKDESFPQDSETTTLDVHNRFKDREMLDGSLSVWEDDDTRSFYENLPDLKAFIPGILFKDSSQPVPQNQTEAVEKLEEDLSQLEIEESELLETETKEEVKESSKADDKDLTETLMQEMDETEEEAAATNTANKVLLDHFLNSLLNCVNREMIDQAAVDFCMNLNTRPNRKKLVKALFLVPRTRLDLLFLCFVLLKNLKPFFSGDFFIIWERHANPRRPVSPFLFRLPFPSKGFCFLVEMYPELVNEDVDKKKSQQPIGDDDSLCPIEEEDEEYEDDAQSEASIQDGETEGDTDGYSGSQSQPFEDDGEGGGRQGTSLSDADNDPVYDGEAPVVKSSAQAAHCAEDDDFMAAFDKMLSDSILHRNQESVKPQVDIVIPMNIKGSAIKKTPKFIPPTITSPPEVKEPEKPTVNFVLMTRKGNKQQFKNLAVPVTSELAQNLKDREEAERMEKQHVKLLTLNINERQEEEDYQEMLASQQRPSVMNLNRDRRQKYHHPKGAPDVDLIFGNK